MKTYKPALAGSAHAPGLVAMQSLAEAVKAAHPKATQTASGNGLTLTMDGPESSITIDITPRNAYVLQEPHSGDDPETLGIFDLNDPEDAVACLTRLTKISVV